VKTTPTLSSGWGLEDARQLGLSRTALDAAQCRPQRSRAGALTQRSAESVGFISPSPNAPRERREAGGARVSGGPFFPLSLSSEVEDGKSKLFCNAVQGSAPRSLEHGHVVLQQHHQNHRNAQEINDGPQTDEKKSSWKVFFTPNCTDASRLQPLGTTPGTHVQGSPSLGLPLLQA